MLDIGKSSFTWSSLELWGLSTKTIQTNHWQTSIWTTTRLKIWHKLNTHSIRHASTIIWKALRCDTTQTTTLKVRVWVPRHTTPLTHTNFFFVFARWGVVWLVRASTYPPPLIMLASFLFQHYQRSLFFVNRGWLHLFQPYLKCLGIRGGWVPGGKCNWKKNTDICHAQSLAATTCVTEQFSWLTDESIYMCIVQ